VALLEPQQVAFAASLRSAIARFNAEAVGNGGGPPHLTFV
jgi:hypothetical protein